MQVDENVCFVDETKLDCITLRFIHRLLSDHGRPNAVTHRVEIHGPGSDAIGPQIGPPITGGIATAALCTLPQERTQLLVAALMVVVTFSGVVALVMVNMTTMADVAPSEQGLAGGLLLTCEQLGGALVGLFGLSQRREPEHRHGQRA